MSREKRRSKRGRGKEVQDSKRVRRGRRENRARKERGGERGVPGFSGLAKKSPREA